MAITTRWVDLRGEDGSFRAYQARPSGEGRLPALIVAQEAFGVNEHVQDVTRRFAEQGYVALAPELFHRFPAEQRIIPYDQLPAARGLLNQLRDDQIIADIRASLLYLQGDFGVRADRIGIVGYCMGGRVAFLAAGTFPELAAAASYYGGRIVSDERNEARPTPPIELAEKIKAPIILFFGDQDQSIPVPDVHKIDETLKSLGKDYELKLYEGAGHGFFCDQRPSYHPEAAADAWRRTLAFFEQHLKS